MHWLDLLMKEMWEVWPIHSVKSFVVLSIKDGMK